MVGTQTHVTYKDVPRISSNVYSFLHLFQTIRFPFYYRTKKHRRYAALAVALGLTLALVDAVISAMGYEKRRPGCPAAGCFGIDATDEYWSLGNDVSESTNDEKEIAF